MGQNMD